MGAREGGEGGRGRVWGAKVLAPLIAEALSVRRAITARDNRGVVYCLINTNINVVIELLIWWFFFTQLFWIIGLRCYLQGSFVAQVKMPSVHFP